MIKNILKYIIIGVILSPFFANAVAPLVFRTGQGGTGISTTPSYGQLLMGNNSSGYTLTATSSLGIVSEVTGLSNPLTADIAGAGYAILNIASTTVTATTTTGALSLTTANSGIKFQDGTFQYTGPAGSKLATVDGSTYSTIQH